MSVDPLGDHDPSTTVLTTVIARTEGRFRTFLAETRPPIHFAEVLGRGGEGVVRAAQQTSIGRDVAVKSPLTNEDGFVAGVLQEAWAAGALEHPNIVPIHDIVVLDGTPHVVMKRIQGLPWSKLLADAGAVESAFGESDLERWNLDVLVQVCHAVEYAHARGILHRDLKPDNVMIGRFGEVWLVDWGLAVRLGEEPARLPRAADQQGIHGTPSFMAPEMAHGDGAAYGTGTDVYLLGGILHLLVLGRPPHTGRTTIDALRSAVQKVRIPEGTPLRGLLERTLAMDVSERPSASDVRREIQAFLARRAARPLFERASAALEELEALAGSRDAERTTLYDLYGAARFGFSEARTIDAGLEEAAERSARATRALIAYELGSGDDRAASLLLAHLPAPEPELEARIARVEEERVAARARLEAFEREVDPRTGIQARAILVLALFSSWLAAPAVTVAAGMTAGFAREIGISVVISVFTVAVFLALRRSLVASRMNRTLLFLLFLAPSMAAVLNLGGWLWGFSSDITGTLEIFLNLTLAVVAMGLVDWRLFPAVLGFAVAYLLAMWHQGGHTLLFLNGADAFAGLVALAIWSPELLRRPLSRGSSPPGSP